MNDLSAERVAALLTTSRLGRSLELKPSTSSTNDDARRASSAGAADGHAIVADAQSRGRGSRGKSWHSPPGTDLYLSIVAHVDVPATALPPLTLAVGLAAALAVEPFLGAPGTKRALVKWPNDVWVGREKLVGVLIEGASMGDHCEPLVVGIGINVNRTTFPEDLAVPATSIALQRGQAVDRSAVLAALLNQLEPWLDRFVAEGAGPIVQAVGERLALRGERVECAGAQGELRGIASSGALLLHDGHSLLSLTSGTLRPCEPPRDAPA